MQLTYKGSVKDIYQIGEELVFQYSDRYSIFDWGEMPDEIENKGQALASLAKFFFDFLADTHNWEAFELPRDISKDASENLKFKTLLSKIKKEGVSSHFISSFNKNSVRVKKVNVLKPSYSQGVYDYQEYASHPENILVPMEVVFRLSLGQGNSFEARIKENPQYLKEIGLNQIPESKVFEVPLIEMSTKLESTDRYLSPTEITKMQIATIEELKEIECLSQILALRLKDLFIKSGIQLWDGKFEFAFGKRKSDGNREIILVDSIGPDELRLTYKGLPLSKEFLRQLYQGSSWYQAVQRAKKIAKERKTKDWKTICLLDLNQKPQPLTLKQKQNAAHLYMALANELAISNGKETVFSKEVTLFKWFQDVSESESLVVENL